MKQCIATHFFSYFPCNYTVRPNLCPPLSHDKGTVPNWSVYKLVLSLLRHLDFLCTLYYSVADHASRKCISQWHNNSITHNVTRLWFRSLYALLQGQGQTVRKTGKQEQSDSMQLQMFFSLLAPLLWFTCYWKKCLWTRGSVTITKERERERDTHNRRREQKFIGPSEWV